jgi:nicotinate-nucleotide adenylyltransferase
MSTIGILGGTFDPIHFGHLRLAEEAREAWPCDRILFLPAQISPLKRDVPPTPGEHRLAMVNAAIAEHPGFESTDLELRRPGPSFMVDTLEELRRLYPNDQLVLILGMDAFRLFPKWKNWRRITELAHLFIGERPGEQRVDPVSLLSIESPESVCYDQAKELYTFKTGFLLKFYSTTRLDISATDLRKRAASERSLHFLTPHSVLQYIEKNGLYRHS